MNKVSHCCHREIIARIHLEYPLGGSRWSIPYKYDACAGCGNEVEEYVDVCEECGEVGCSCDAGTVPMVSKEDAEQTEQQEVS